MTAAREPCIHRHETRQDAARGRNVYIRQRPEHPAQKAVEALKSHRKRQLEERMASAGHWQDQGLVFPSSVGTPLGARNLQRHFKAVLEQAGLPAYAFTISDTPAPRCFCGKASTRSTSRSF